MEFKIEDTIEILSKTPPTLESLLQGLPDRWLEANEGPETWSCRQVLGHLIHGERTDWMPRTRIILKRQHRVFEPFDRYEHLSFDPSEPIGSLLDTFRELRQNNLAELSSLNLSPAKLKLRGTHPDLGRVSLKQLLSTWAVHDLGHIGQIVRVLARQYTSKVGPWKAYLSILGKDVKQPG